MSRYLPKNYTAGTAYPLGDRPTREELGISYAELLKSPGLAWAQFRAVPTGEKRAPKKGEWYLSGAEVTGYKAFGDLTSEYLIAKLAKVERVPERYVVVG